MPKFRIFSFLLALICFSIQEYVTAQTSLYIPRDVKQAFKKETRASNGMPGKNYWQNTAKYSITMTAMPPDRNIAGTEQITYFNNSPDTLKRLTLKLFLNIHQPGASREGSASAEYLTSGLHIDSFGLNGSYLAWKDRKLATTSQAVALPVPLLPHDSIHLSFAWHYQISLESQREGMIDPTTYFLAYFYPRIAVYDDYQGWDIIPFVESKEFYSDFNDYTVTIKVPKNYIVWGTGTLQKPETLLQPDFNKRLAHSFTSDDVIQIASLKELKEKKVTVQNALNSWQFKASHIPDMAFGLSDHFVWDASSVEVDKKNHRRASVQAAYNDTSADFHHMVKYGKHALNWFSINWPGVSYPYEKSTIFQGFAGMEYPMMVNDESYQDSVFSRLVAEHEIAHTYMPFYMGINETRYGFMDEGWATTFEYLVGINDVGKNQADNVFKEFRVSSWSQDKSSDQDLPIITPGTSMTGNGLGNNEYGKASLGYLAMKDLLGDTLFKTCLHAYMDRWHSKHPIPWDFFNTFSNVSGKNLNWFWSNWFFSNNYIDLAIGRHQQGPQGTDVEIQNVGGMASPFDLIATYADGTSSRFHQTPAVWQFHEKQVNVLIPNNKKISSLVIDSGIFMDADESNNTWKNGK